MDVAGLIKELKKQPLDAEVYISQKDCKYSWVCEVVEDDDLNIDWCITLSGG